MYVWCVAHPVWAVIKGGVWQPSPVLAGTNPSSPPLLVVSLPRRCAGVVVLVSLLQLCTGSALLHEQLPRLQATFTGLLGDSNDLTQV